MVTYGERVAGGILLRAEGVARCYGKDFANGTLMAFLGCQRLWVTYRTLEEAERRWTSWRPAWGPSRRGPRRSPASGTGTPDRRPPAVQ
jgi:hypothetical protein